MYINRFNNIFIKNRFIFNHYNVITNNYNLKYLIHDLKNQSIYTYFSYSTKRNNVSKSDDLIKKKDDSPITFDESGVIKCTKDQWLYKPTAREIKLFLDSKMIPTKPFDLENSVVVKLVDLNKGVSSPVRSTVYYSEYGIRKGERLKLIVIWVFVCSVCTYLGFWQLKRRKWKEDLIEKRQRSLTMPILNIESLSDISSVDFNNSNNNCISIGNTASNSDGSNDLLYRIIEAKGVLDTKEQFLVGPRPSLTHDYGDQTGYYVLYPLRFRDGSSILVNMGWLKGDDVFDMNVSSEWVTVRGVLISGEITESLVPSFKHKVLSFIERLSKQVFNKELKLTAKINRASRLIKNDQRKVYRYLDPESIGSQVFSTEPELTQKYLLNVYDSYFDEDKPILEKESNDTKSGLLNRLIRVSGIRPLFDSDLKSKDSSTSSSSDQNRQSPHRYDFQRKQKSDYLLFYADPGTHFNYAMQWFLMAFSISAMCVYKLIKVNRIIKNLNL